MVGAAEDWVDENEGVVTEWGDAVEMLEGVHVVGGTEVMEGVVGGSENRYNRLQI